MPLPYGREYTPDSAARVSASPASGDRSVDIVMPVPNEGPVAAQDPVPFKLLDDSGLSVTATEHDGIGFDRIDSRWMACRLGANVNGTADGGDEFDENARGGGNVSMDSVMMYDDKSGVDPQQLIAPLLDEMDRDEDVDMGMGVSAESVASRHDSSDRFDMSSSLHNHSFSQSQFHSSSLRLGDWRTAVDLDAAMITDGLDESAFRSGILDQHEDPFLAEEGETPGASSHVCGKCGKHFREPAFLATHFNVAHLNLDLPESREVVYNAKDYARSHW